MSQKETSKTAYSLNNLPQVDSDLDMFELCDRFYEYYTYLESDCSLDYEHITKWSRKGGLESEQKTMPRNAALRRIEASKYGARPYIGNKGISRARPNVSLGYMSQICDYTTLPYKTVFQDSDYVDIEVNKRLYQDTKKTDSERDDLDIQEANNPNAATNALASKDLTYVFNEVLDRSKPINKTHEQVPDQVGFLGCGVSIHDPDTYTFHPIHLLDLVFEPFASWDPSEWSSYFYIERLSTAKVMKLIREYEETDKNGEPKKKDSYWSAPALRWALNSSCNDLDFVTYSDHRNLHHTCINGENSSVASLYRERGGASNRGTYSGYVTVVNAVYLNSEGKVNHVKFFPSADYLHKSPKQQTKMKNMTDEEKEKKMLTGAGYLFSNVNKFTKMQESITVIPKKRSEPTIERQRGTGHETFSIFDAVSKIDSSILNTVMLMGISFYRDPTEDTHAEKLEDLSLDFQTDMVNMGKRVFQQSFFQADLSGMMAVRTQLLQHGLSKAFLGGLDNTETLSNNMAHKMGHMRLNRDGRVLKNEGEYYARGLTEMYGKSFMGVLKQVNNNTELEMPLDTLIQKIFLDQYTKSLGHPREFLKYKESDILEDTGLPYWLDIEAIRNAGSSFGAAELLNYQELMNTFGGNLGQNAIGQMARNSMISLLGSQKTMDIMGDPREENATDARHAYWAKLENGAILGGVESGAVVFEQIPVLMDAHDHVIHATSAHLPKASQILEMLEGHQFDLQDLDAITEDQLVTKNSLTLQLAAMANHLQQHQAGLERFGDKRDDVNQLKEQINTVIQKSEGYLNGLTDNLQALQTKREKKRLMLETSTPSTPQEEKMLQLELMKLEAQERKDMRDFEVAVALKDKDTQQHQDSQVSKARDRYQREISDKRKDETERLKIQASANNKSATTRGDG